jgi:methionine-rich copper-binding protein CopC
VTIHQVGAAGRPRWLLVALALVGAVVAVVAATAPASAHNVLVSNSPSDGQRVARTPAMVVLTFDEPAIAMGTQVVVTGSTGEVQQGQPQLVDNTVTQALRGGAPAGSYQVSWRITSADGHPISGTFAFTAEAAGSGPAAPTPSAPATAKEPGSPFAGWLVAGLAAAVVVTVVLSVVRSRRRSERGAHAP